MTLAFLGNPEQIGVILIVVLVLFGAKRLPELARSMGQGVKEFRKAAKEITEDIANTTVHPEPADKRVVRAVTEDIASTSVQPGPADKSA